MIQATSTSIKYQMTRPFFSHSQRDASGLKTGSKLLVEHTSGVKQLALSQFYAGIDLGFETEMLCDLLKDICTYHDLGKYTPDFQNYLLGLPHDAELKAHARFGAFACYQKWLQKQSTRIQAKAFLAYYVILHHHRSLSTPGLAEGDRFFSGYQRSDVIDQFEAQAKSIDDSLGKIIAELKEPLLRDFLALPNKKQMGQFIGKWVKGEPNIQKYFLINYLFSLLIEADKLDASDTSLYRLKPLDITAVDRVISSFPKSDTPQNRLRTQVRQKVLSHLAHEEILSYRLFLLTAPTGIGKTLTALDYAVRLRKLIAEKEQRQAQIITALPFINIIEQTLEVYDRVFPLESAKILGHYQYADIFGQNQKNRSSLSDDWESNYEKKAMELDTWQSDIVVTSFVQFLQSLITGNNRLLKKFNHFAGAIIIMDEVQSLRLEQVPLIGAVLYYLTKFLDTRLILMTATQPLIFELADKVLLEKKGINSSKETFHLLPEAKEIFEQFHRTRLVPLLKEKIESEEDFVEVFEKNWKPSQSAIIVCNTVNRSLKVYRVLQEKLTESNHVNPIFYLSTNVLPIERLARINEIKQALNNHLSPIVVSTQVVEAGVDLDFDMGFRDLGPVDSIIQVAGRINRENSPDRAYAPLYIVDLGDCQKIYGSPTYTQVQIVLSKPEIKEPEYYELIAQYFDINAQQATRKYAKCMMEALEQLRYTGNDKYTISDFQVIAESQSGISVFVEINEAAEAAKKAFLRKLETQLSFEERSLRKREFNQNYKRTFHQCTIVVPSYFTAGLPWLDESLPDIQIKYVSHLELNTWYLSDTGFNRDHASSISAEDHSTFIF